MITEEILKVAEEVKKQSDDPFRQVASIIIGNNNEIIAKGANAFLPKTINAKKKLEKYKGNGDWRYYLLEHAERNAINDARRRELDINGCFIYSSLFPCADCARAIVEAGIKKVFVPRPDEKTKRNEKWINHFIYSEEIFNLAEVEIVYI